MLFKDFEDLPNYTTYLETNILGDLHGLVYDVTALNTNTLKDIIIENLYFIHITVSYILFVRFLDSCNYSIWLVSKMSLVLMIGKELLRQGFIFPWAGIGLWIFHAYSWWINCSTSKRMITRFIICNWLQKWPLLSIT